MHSELIPSGPVCSHTAVLGRDCPIRTSWWHTWVSPCFTCDMECNLPRPSSQCFYSKEDHITHVLPKIWSPVFPTIARHTTSKKNITTNNQTTSKKSFFFPGPELNLYFRWLITIYIIWACQGYLPLNSCWIAMCGFLVAFSVSWFPVGIVQEASAICCSGKSNFNAGIMCACTMNSLMLHRRCEFSRERSVFNH